MHFMNFALYFKEPIMEHGWSVLVHRPCLVETEHELSIIVISLFSVVLSLCSVLAE